jgi:DNA end-binding protein Ku
VPRSLWNGTVAFGLVRVPVKLYSATESHTVPLHERHAGDGAAIEHRRVCEKEDREVPYKEVVKGYEVRKGSFVVLSKEEIAAADGPGAHVIDVEHFVCREEIDPVFYDRSYYVGPGADGDDSYRLFHAALRRSDRVAIGRFVFHNRARLVALRALDDVIALHAMRFADELLPADKLDIETPSRRPSKRELEMAATLVEQLEAGFDPGQYKDGYRDAVMKIIKAKAAGREIEMPDEPDAEPDEDLLKALTASLASGGRRGAGGSSRRGAGKGAAAQHGGATKTKRPAGGGGKTKTRSSG